MREEEDEDYEISFNLDRLSPQVGLQTVQSRDTPDIRLDARFDTVNHENTLL